MIEIDGAIGYGQVLRTSIGLSALLFKSVKIFNIRKNRPKPGLMAQHLTGVKVAGELCEAEIKGLRLGSTEIEFVPKKLNLVDKKIDIGTSGSIGLLLQTLTPLLIFSNVALEVKGGTSGLGAPTIEYMKHVTYANLVNLGLTQPEIEIVKQGFYPKGNGLVKIAFKACSKLKHIKAVKRGKIKQVKGISIVGSLPLHVLERQTKAAVKVLNNYGFDVEISNQHINTLSPGTSITLWAECENSVIGADSIGKKGVKADVIGEECAKELIKSLDSEATFDKYMGDQIIPFLALAEGRSEITVEEVTEHCKTNIQVIEKMLPVKFEVENNRIAVEGLGFSLNNLRQAEQK